MEDEEIIIVGHLSYVEDIKSSKKNIKVKFMYINSSIIKSLKKLIKCNFYCTFKFCLKCSNSVVFILYYMNCLNKYMILMSIKRY